MNPKPTRSSAQIKRNESDVLWCAHWTAIRQRSGNWIGGRAETAIVCEIERKSNPISSDPRIIKP